MSIKKQIEQAKSLPVQQNEDWVMERRAVDIRVEELGDIKPHMLLCVSLRTGFVLGVNVISPSAPDSELKEWALNTVLKPMEGSKPYRPGSMTLVNLKPLQETLEQLGIEVTARSLPHPAVDEAVTVFEEYAAAPGQPPYTDDPGVDAETVSGFFSAAAEFYRAKPWKLFDYEVPIMISLQRKKKKVDYWAVVMGVEGREFGLTLYRSFDDLMRIFDAEDEDEAAQAARKMWMIGFSYDDVDAVGSSAKAEVLMNKWVLASESAYPSLIVLDPRKDDRVRRPTRNELVDVTAVTQALVSFFKIHKKQVKEEETIEDTVRVGDDVTAFITSPAPGFFDEYEEEDEDELDDSTIISPRISPELDRAQELVWEALDEESKSKRVKLAKQAIAMSKDCADAYLILAEDAARDPKKMGKFLQDAVDAGRRAIGEELFKELEGNFWLALETRPYMRARLRLAEFREDEGDLDKAIEDQIDMLRLDPNDHLGVRYPLARNLLLKGKDDEVRKLIKGYSEDISAFWLYTKALLAYRKSGDSSQARKDLAKALAENRHVPEYLLERKRPRYVSDTYSPGSEEEATIYWDMFLQIWQSTEGAIEWLRKVSESSSKGSSGASRSGRKSRAKQRPTNGFSSQDEAELYEKIVREHPQYADVLGQDEIIVDGEPMSPRAHMAMHHIVETQLAANDPAEAGETLQRLLNAGMDRHEAIHAIAREVSELMFYAMKHQELFDVDEYSRRLRKLKPL